MVHAMATGVSVPPKPNPHTCRPLANPRSLSAVHEAITRVTLEETAASPTPVRKRTRRKAASALMPVTAASFGTSTIAPAPTAKQRIEAVKRAAGTETVADVSPGNLKESVAPEKGAEYQAHLYGVEGKLFFDVFAGNAQV